MSVILITGAGKGIGRAIALDFAKRTSATFSPKLFITSRTLSELLSLKKECESFGAACHVLEAELSKTDEVNRIYDSCIARFGKVDCLINNAGVGRFKNILDLTEEDYDFTMNTNLKGTFFLTQRTFRDMQARQSGHIFFVTSTAAEKAFAQSGLYCMSKFGQKGLVEVLRLYGRECNVRITNVMPGPVYTPMWGEARHDFAPKMMMPEDIAAPIVDAFLLPSRTSIEEIVLRPVTGDI
jgi:sepiapterin reductase